MALSKIRLANKQKAVVTALDCFVEKEIEISGIINIAKEIGLTERSVFRYYKNKPELVPDALLYL